MKLALVAFASILCAGGARAGDESLLPLRLWNTPYQAGPQAVDFDGNGRKEVVTLSSPDEPPAWTMTVLGIGPYGDLLSETSLSVPSGGNTAAADFDGDGREELAIAGGNVYVYRAGLDGVPTLWKTIAIPATGGTSIEVADFDGDTWPDMLVSEQDASSTKPFRLLRNTGGTGFQVLTAVLGSGMAPSSMDLGDLNGDGKLDVLASEQGNDLVRVLLAQPGGLSFTSLNTQPMPDMPYSVCALDLTGDGVIDMAVGVGGSTSGVSCRPGTGGGSFGAASNTPAAMGIGLDKGDIDGDGDLDLVQGSIDHYTYAYANTQALPLAAPQMLRTLHDAPVALMSDVNGDGWSDLLVAPAAATYVGMVFGGPQGLQLPKVLDLVSDPITLHAADVTGDGQPDMISLAAGPRLAVADGHGDGSFGAPVVTNFAPNGTPRDATIGLCDADGLLDVVIVSTGAGSHLRVANGNGASKTFSSGDQATAPDGPAAGPLAVDLDGDGVTEICLPTTSGVVRVWHDGPAGHLASGGVFPVPEAAGGNLAWGPTSAGDLNEDGLLDIVFAAGEVIVMPGQPGGGLGPATILNPLPGGPVTQVFAVDIDEDGLMDLVGAGGQVSSVWLGQPGLGFGAQQIAGGAPYVPACADMDADGHIDLVGAVPFGSNAPYVQVQRGLGNGQFLPAMKFSTYAIRLAIADFTSDGVPDIVTSADFEVSSQPQDAEQPRLLVSHGQTRFTDLGQALGGAQGDPQFLAWGWLKPGQTATLAVARAKPLAPAALFAGLSQAYLPFKGGTLVPSIDLLLPAFVTDSKGRIELALPWPAGVPSGLSFSMQWWFADASGPAGFTASNALTAMTP